MFPLKYVLRSLGDATCSGNFQENTFWWKYDRAQTGSRLAASKTKVNSLLIADSPFPPFINISLTLSRDVKIITLDCYREFLLKRWSTNEIVQRRWEQKPCYPPLLTPHFSALK